MALPIRKKEENIFEQIGGFFGDVGKNVGTFIGSLNKPQQQQPQQQAPRPQQPASYTAPTQQRPQGFNSGVASLGSLPQFQQKTQRITGAGPLKIQTPDEYRAQKQQAIQSVVDTGNYNPKVPQEEVPGVLMKRVQNQAGGTPQQRAVRQVQEDVLIKPITGVVNTAARAVDQTLKDPLGTAQGIIQAPFRAGATVARSLGDTSDFQSTPLRRFLYGEEPIQNLEQSGRKFVNSTQGLLTNDEKSDAGDKINPFLAVGAGLLGSATDLLPGGGIKKVAIKGTAKAAESAVEKAASSPIRRGIDKTAEAASNDKPQFRENMLSPGREEETYDINRKLLPPVDPSNIAPYTSSNSNIPLDIARAAEEQKQRYAPVTKRQAIGETINPYRAGVLTDAKYAEQQGIPLRDVPKNQSLEALAERTRNSGQEAQAFLERGNIAPVLQKYGAKTPESQEFNTYRTFMRDMEQRADGRAPLYKDRSNEEIAKFVQDYELRNPNARQDLKAVVNDIERVQDEAVKRGVVDAETVNAARMKKDGGRYEFYTPVSRASPENLERASINANGVGSIGRQSIIQDMKGSDIPLDPSFDSITDYVNNAYRQMAKAQTSQVFAERVKQGLVPGARFVDTAENDAARRAMRNEQKRTGETKNMNDYAELRADPTTGLQVISGRSNGSTFKIEVPPEQARFLQGLGEEKLNTLGKIAKATQTPFRTVLTGALNLPFQVISAGFNAIMAPTLSPQGFRVLAPKAVAESLRSFNKNSEFQQLLRANGAQSFTGNLAAGKNKPTTAEQLAAQRNFASQFKFDLKNPSRLWEKLDAPGAGLENAQRTGIAKAAFDARLRKGGDEGAAIADAVYAYNNVLPNFGRVSSLVRQVDAALMYTGANVAGTRSMLTAIKRDPVGVGTRLSLVTTGLVGLTAYTLSQDEAQAFYEDMHNTGKDYITDNNGIVMLPGAHKVTKDEADSGQGKEGEWVGVIKLPLPPELRPVQHAITSQMLANSKDENVPVGDYAQAAFDFVSGGARTLANPLMDLGYGLATNVDRSTGREIVPAELQRKQPSEQAYPNTSEVAKNIAGALGISPLKVDYALSKAGFPGQIAKGVGEEGGVTKSTGEAIANRFTNTFGEKESTRFYNQLDKIAKSIPADDDMKAFEALHSKKDDESRSLDKTAERYKILLARPGVLDAERQLDAFNRSQGKPGNPLFDLAPDQQEKVFRYRASKDLNAAKQAYDKNGNPLYTALGLDEKWYDDFRNAESNFYGGLKQKNEGDGTNTALSFSGAQRPQPSAELQAKLDTYYTIPGGTGERSAFLKQNPDVLEHWAKGDQFTNAERIAIGLEPVSDEEKSSGGKFARSSKGGGGARSNPNRITIKSSDYDNPISIDSAPKARITVKSNNKKVAIKARKARNAKVTTTKQKSGKIKVNNQKKQTS